MTEDAPRSEPETLLTSGEVATLFRVTTKTVTRWAEAGKLPAIRTLGGHRRFPAREVLRVRDEMDSGLSSAWS